MRAKLCRNPPCMAPGANAAIQALRAERLGMLRIAKQLGCGVSTVQRVLSEPTAR